MQPFAFERPMSPDAAVRSAAAPRASATLRNPAQYLAGGTTLVDLMKLDVMQPQTVIDINGLGDTQLGRIEASQDGIRLGALVRMSDAADHPLVKRVPMIVQALELAASPQIRNMASLGGNVLQRTRCPYFRDVSYQACNKRNPGAGCAAMDGVNRDHAVLGTSDNCIATYPGDFAQALIALDASVEIMGTENNGRTIRFAALHRPPGETPDVETTLRPGEMITAFEVPIAPWMRRSLYLKVRDRASYEFALASAAVALDLRDGVVAEARIGLGGVATVPWRAASAEAALRGQPINDTSLAAAADSAFAEAHGRRHNAYKIALGRRTLVRALREAAAIQI